MTKFRSVASTPQGTIAVTEAGDLVMVEFGQPRSMTAAGKNIPNVKVTHVSVDVTNCPGDVAEFDVEAARDLLSRRSLSRASGQDLERVAETIPLIFPGQRRKWDGVNLSFEVKGRAPIVGEEPRWQIVYDDGSRYNYAESCLLRTSTEIVLAKAPKPQPPLQWWSCYKGNIAGELAGLFDRVLARSESEALNLANGNRPYSQFQKAVPL